MQNPQFLREAQIVLWLQWIFFNLLGWVLGLLLVWRSDDDINTAVLFGIISILWGLGQWVVVRNYCRRPSLAWVGATALGMMLAQLISQTFVQFWIRTFSLSINTMAGGVVVGGIVGVIIGLCIGIFQSTFLKVNGRLLRYWILTNAVGWGLGFQAGTMFVGARLQLTSTIAVLISSTVIGLALTQFLLEDQ